MIELPSIAANYASVLKRAQAASQTREFTLIAVSKGQPAEAIEALYRKGHRDFGENYAQELLQKADELAKLGCPDIRWHFIGHLQTNKVKGVVPRVSCIHSVDSAKLAAAIARNIGPRQPLPVFVEVNIDGEPEKSGVPPRKAAELCRACTSLEGIRLLGLMAVPAAQPDPESSFRELAELELSCRPSTLGFLSMGMSGDFEAALRQGATHIRVGTAIFGPRGS